MISYVEVVQNKLTMFGILQHVCCLETGTSHEKFLRYRTNVTRFDVLEKLKFEFDYQNFFIGNIQHNLYHVNFGIFCTFLLF
jgi:hypothetical protein